jgi:dienelactone hydrolase
MTARWLAAALLGVFSFLACGDAICAATSPAPLPYLADRASRMAAALPAIPNDVAAWERRRAIVRRDLACLLGLPEREPMRAKVTATREDSGIVVEDVIYLWAERAYVSANVVRPKSPAGRLPALVVPPGWLGELKYEYYKTFVDHMARKGYLLLFIDDPHVGRRVAPYAGLYAAAAAAGTQVMGIQVFDTLRGLDYLLTRSDVDPGRIGVAGLCQGSEQTWLAAALDDRFQVAVPVCGTTTYEGWARMPSDTSVDLSDPSPYVAGVLRVTDWHEINACIAPRPVFIASNSGDNWWPVPGYNRVVATLDQVFRLHNKPEHFQHLLALRSHSMTPFIPEISPWIDARLKDRPPASVASQPAAIPADPDLSMLRYAQRRIVRHGESLPASFESREAWERLRRTTVAWLRQSCDLDGLHVGRPKLVSRHTSAGLVTEWVEVPQDQGLVVPVGLFYRDAKNRAPRGAVVLSHDSRQCAADASLVELVKTFAEKEYLVAVPDHASPNPASWRYVRNLSSLYGVSDTVNLPPMAMRVWDDLAATACLAGRSDVMPNRVAILGLGVGGVDASISAALDERIAAVGVVGAITIRDWAEHVAPKLGAFERIMPYLPGIAGKTGLASVYSAAAPRPLLLLDGVDRVHWPSSGYDRVQKTTAQVYRVHGASAALTLAPANSPCGVAEIVHWLEAVLGPGGVSKRSVTSDSGRTAGRE